MVTKYKNAAPVPVCGIAPGGFIEADVVPDPALLLGLGWLVPVESGTASSTIEKPSKPAKEKS